MFEHPFMIFVGVLLVAALLILMKRNFVRFDNRREEHEYLNSRKKSRTLITFTRCLVALLLTLALASPFSLKERTVMGEPTLMMLVDNSSSMELFDMDKVMKLKSQLSEEIPVTLRYIATGQQSAIGDELISHMSGNDNLLVISDGQSNNGRSLGEVMQFSASINSTISTVLLDQKGDDVAVVIEGPSEVIADTENSFRVRVKSVGEQDYKLKVYFDGTIIHNENHKGSYTHEFSRAIALGYHKIRAELETEDFFATNNKYYKVVEGLPKPKVTVVSDTDDSPLLDLLRQVYEVRQQAVLPSDLKDINALVIINKPVKQLEESFEKLNDYLTDGGGLLVIGGKNAYDGGSYKESLFETLLPVRVGVGKREEDQEVNVVVVIDISQSTGRRFSYESKDLKVEVEKALAISVVDSLSTRDKVAVVAFNTEGFLVSPLAPLTDRIEVQSRIASLQQGGGTVMLMGLSKAYEQLTMARGSKHIIVVSDGKTLMKEETLLYAERLCNEGVKVYTVGVGMGTQSNYLRAVAEAGCTNFYFEPDQTQQLKVIFGEEKEEKGKDLVVMNTNHFITNDLKLRAALTGFNFGIPKSTAQVMVTTIANNPILVVWRFGLGRVATLLTGSPWMGDLFSKNNSRLITRTINWISGDIRREQQESIKTKNLFVNEKNTVIFHSKEEPDIESWQIAESAYAHEITPQEKGFHDFLSGIVAVNYQREFLNLGQSGEWFELAKLTNGDVFTTSDAEAIKSKVITDSTKQELQKVYYRWPLVIIAIVIFLIDVSMRIGKKHKNM